MCDNKQIREFLKKGAVKFNEAGSMESESSRQLKRVRPLVLPLISEHACRPSADLHRIATAQIKKKKNSKRVFFVDRQRQTNEPAHELWMQRFDTEGR